MIEVLTVNECIFIYLFYKETLFDQFNDEQCEEPTLIFKFILTYYWHGFAKNDIWGRTAYSRSMLRTFHYFLLL